MEITTSCFAKHLHQPSDEKHLASDIKATQFKKKNINTEYNNYNVLTKKNYLQPSIRFHIGPTV